MVTDPHTRTPGQVFGHRVKEARKRRGWSQNELADRLEEVGLARIDRTVIARIERGGSSAGSTRAENVKLSELFAFAVALDVPPVHLLVPLEDDAIMAVTPKIEAIAPVVREWVRGRIPLWNKRTGEGDVRAFLLELPESELQELIVKTQARGLSTIAREFVESDPDEARKFKEALEDEFAAGEASTRREKP